MAARYVPHTIMAGRLFPSDHQLQPETVVDSLLTVYGLVGHTKVKTMDELRAAIESAWGREGAITVWVIADLEDRIRPMLS